MEPYIGHLISVLVMLAGLAGVYTKIVARLATIETRLDRDDKNAPERVELDKSRAKTAAAEYCSESCPRRKPGTTGDRIPQYLGEVSP